MFLSSEISVNKLMKGDKTKKYPGLKNLGNSCYMNAALQCLAHCIPINEYCKLSYFTTIDFSSTEVQILYAFCNLIREMNRNLNAINPTEFYETFLSHHPAFQPKAQQDSQEFLKILLDCLQTAYKQILGTDSTIISMSFMGKIAGIIRCKECKHEHHRVEDFIDLSIQVPNKSEITVSNEESKQLMHPEDLTFYNKRSDAIKYKILNIVGRKGVNVISLYDCIQAYFLPEEIDEISNLFECAKCGRLSSTTNETSISQAPNILILTLKRFRIKNYNISKIKSHVQLTLKLDLSSFCVETAKYELCAVIEHKGRLSSGHYRSFVRANDGNWYRFNDNQAKIVIPQKVLNAKAYLAFYSRIIPHRPTSEYSEQTITIPKEWVLRYETLTNPGTLDVDSVLCLHSQYKVDRKCKMTTISHSVLLHMSEVYQIDLSLYQDTNICQQCTQIIFRIKKENELRNALLLSETQNQKAVLDVGWYFKWTKFLKWNTSEKVLPEFPGKIINSHLIESDQVKTNLQRDIDYMLINLNFWTALATIYDYDEELILGTDNIYSEVVKDNPVILSETIQDLVQLIRSVKN